MFYIATESNTNKQLFEVRNREAQTNQKFTVRCELPL